MEACSPTLQGTNISKHWKFGRSWTQKYQLVWDMLVPSRVVVFSPIVVIDEVHYKPPTEQLIFVRTGTGMTDVHFLRQSVLEFSSQKDWLLVKGFAARPSSLSSSWLSFTMTSD